MNRFVDQTEKVNLTPLLSNTQNKRTQSLHSFERWALYLPLGIAFSALLLMGALIFFAVLISKNGASTIFLSTTADLLFIVTMIPLLLICAIFPITVFGSLYYLSKENKKPIVLLQSYLRQLESYLHTIDHYLKRNSEKTTAFFLQSNESPSFLKRSILFLKYFFTGAN